MESPNKEYLKEALKVEVEKLRIYATYFAGLLTVIGSLVLRENFTTNMYVVLAVATVFFIVNILTLVIALVRINQLLNLLKIE